MNKINANLIAAASDLLNALEALLYAYRFETMSDGAKIDGPDCRSEVIDARAAIAKAKA